jgi:hypothetical protein
MMLPAVIAIVIGMMRMLTLTLVYVCCSKQSYRITGSTGVTRRAGANSVASLSNPNSHSGTRYAIYSSGTRIHSLSGNLTMMLMTAFD